MKTDSMRARDSFGADFATGYRVWIDGDHLIDAVVTGLRAKGGCVQLTTRDRALGMSLSPAEATLHCVKTGLPSGTETKK